MQNYQRRQITLECFFQVSIDAGNTKDNKEISSQTINDAVSMLGALLNVRDFFTRIASDVEVANAITYSINRNINITYID